jgi:antirestriction protein ArdC
MTKTKTDLYERVTDQIITALEAGTVPWSKPWDPRIGLPVSISTSKLYRGINIFLLSLAQQAAGYDSPWWATYKKIAELGGQVRQGEKSTMVTFWKTGETPKENEVTGDTEMKRWAVLRSYLVFNACQADGLPEKYATAPDATANTPLLACADVIADDFAQDNAPALQHGGPSAFYSPGQDLVQLPVWESFAQAEGYYSTAFHEMGHSTGHSSRLNREGQTEGHSYGDELYSKEELVAEMTAAMLCGFSGIEQETLPRSAAYIRSWIGALKGDTRLIVQAAGQAQRATDLILGTTFDNEQETNA